jgi:methyl-accepting chemotaxis protein
MRLGLTIAAKLAIAYCLFLAPIGYLGYQMVSDKQTNIAFAQKEIVGLHYIALVRGVQDALVRGSDGAGLAARIRANETALGADLNTAEAADAVVKALAGTDRAATAQAAADLIGKAADGSNLTLDTDLDSFYTQDALTVKMATAVAGVASLAAAVAGTAGHDMSAADQVSIGVQVGALQPTLDGLASDIANAVKGNPDKTVDGAVTAPVAKVGETAKAVLASLADHARAADAQTIALPLLDAITAAGTADAGEVEHLLTARVAGLRSVELTSGGIALALFLTAVSYVLIAIQRRTVAPLCVLTATMRRLADHELTVEIGGSGRGDEVGSMARAVQVFRDSMVQADRLAAEQQTQKAAAAAAQKAIRNQTADAFERKVGGLVSILSSAATELQATADSMSGTATRTNDQAATVAAAADQASAGVGTVAAAAEELTASIGEISRQVVQSTDIAAKAALDAQRTDAIVQTLADGADKIGRIVGLIRSIAGRTNLLALNATIEAARAGDSGKGFAVVASEVKTLATQTSKATEEISTQVVQIQSATREVVAAIRGITATVEQVGCIATMIAAAVEEQGSATGEIARSVQQAAESAQAVTTNIGGVSEAVAETQTAADQVQSAAVDVSRQAGHLAVEVGNFIAEVRAA